MLRARKDSSKTKSGNLTATPSGRLQRPSRRGSSTPSSTVGGLVAFAFFVGVVIFITMTEHGEDSMRKTNPNIRTSGAKKDSNAAIKYPPNPLFPTHSMFKEGPAKQVEKVSKKGAVVHKTITSVKKDDLKGLAVDLPDNLEDITYEQALEGRERLVDILTDAGVGELDIPSILSLPKWSSVAKLYGEEPVVIGLETCERFRDTIPLDDASIGTAGMFNTGTNPFAMYIEANCIMPHNTHDKHGGTRWQVPWGKHTLASRKWTHTAGHDQKTNKTNVLPVAIVRDPYSWMQSMCKHPYVAKWIHKKHCPNLVPTPEDMQLPDNPKFPVKDLLGDTVGVRVKYDPVAEFKSLAHYWTQWYREYLDADYPRLIVRFEDLQFHAKEMINIVCQCAGAVPRDPNAEFTYIVDAAKWGNGHRGKQTNLISAMIKYGTDAKRFDGMTKEDLQHAAEALDPELMELFHYEIPSL